MVELIFGVEEGARLRSVAPTALGDGADVAAGAEAAPLRVIDRDQPDRRILAPLDERRTHRLAHPKCQRMERLGPVEAKTADPALGADQYLVGHCRSSSRATMTRITSFVPSRIRCTRRSRQKRSIG